MRETICNLYFSFTDVNSSALVILCFFISSKCVVDGRDTLSCCHVNIGLLLGRR